MRINNTQRTLDVAGIWVSALCGLHCVAVPFLISTAAIGWTALEHPSIEYTVLGLSAVLGIVSLLPSYLKRHRKINPIITLILGFLFIGASRLVEEGFVEGLLTATGACAIVFSHIANIRYCKKHHAQK